MSRWILGIFAILTFCVQLNAQSQGRTGRDDYFFPPPRGLYFFRPDLYVYQVPRHRHYYSGGGYTRPYYVAPSRLNFPVRDSYRGWGETYFPGNRNIYRVVLTPPPTGGFYRVNTADLIFSVTPANALVYVDGRLIGSARDFATERDRYSILDGEHELRLEYPGYVSFQAPLQVTADRTLHLEIVLEKVRGK